MLKTLFFVGVLLTTVSGISGLLLFIVNTYTGNYNDSVSCKAYRSSIVAVSVCIAFILCHVLMGGV